MPAVGGAIAGAILQLAAKRLPKRGAADYMEAIAVGRGVIGFRQTIARSLSSIFFPSDPAPRSAVRGPWCNWRRCCHR